VLGPFGRGFERRGIAAEGKRLEQTRLQEEAAQREKERLAALEEERAFKLTPPEGLIGPEAPAELQQQRLQARLAEIEQEVQVARQARDIDKLLQLQRERTALEAQGPAFELQQQQQRVEALRKREEALRNAIESTPNEDVKNRLSNQLEFLSAERAHAEMELGQQQQAEANPDFEKRRDLEKRISALESLEVKLQERADAATLVGRQPILASLTSVQAQLKAARSDLEAGEQSGALPKLEKSDAPLLKREQAAIKALLAARETGSGAAQEQAAARLNQIEEQLGLFGMESFAANEREAALLREAEAKRQARARSNRLLGYSPPPIQMGVNTNLFTVPPYGEQGLASPSQETLFGPPERQFETSTDQAGMPQRQLQQAIETLATKPDLKPEDRALLERVQAVATPAPGLRTDEVLQGRLRSLQELRSKLEAELLARGDRALKADEAAAAEEGVEPEDTSTLSDREKLRILRQLAAPRPAAGKRPGDVSADLPAQRGKYALQGDPKLAALIKRLDRLDQIEAEFNERLAAADRKPLTQLEKLSTTGAVPARERVAQIQKEVDALERGAQTDKTMSGRQKLDRIAQLKEEQAALRSEAFSLRQRITDWLSDTARGLDNTNSRRALEEELQQLEAATRRGDKEALTTTRRRIATPEERALLGGKKTVTERVPTGITVEAQQPELFAGTEAAGAVEFETPKQFQKFMGSEELNKLRRQQGLLKPTIAYLQKQAAKIENVLKRLNARLENFKLLREVRTEDADRALAKARQQYAAAWQEVLNALPSQHAQYQRAKEALANAQETYAGLADFQQAAMRALDRDLAVDSAWAQTDRAAKARFLAELQGPKQQLEAAIAKLGAIREQIAQAQIGEATDPFTALWPQYSQAKKEAQTAYEDFQKVATSRKKVAPPANATVASREIKNFLVQDAELTEMLIQQRRAVYQFEMQLQDAQQQLAEAKKAVAQDPVMRGYLDAAEDALDAAQSFQIPSKGAATVEPITVPVKLQEAIRKANKQLNRVRQEARAPQDEKTRRERRLEEIGTAERRQQKTSEEIRAENERLEREAEATTRVTFEKLSPEKQKALDEAKQQLETAIKNKQAAIEKKQNQTTNFRLSPELQKAVAEKKQTKAEAIEEQRADDIKKISAMFDEKIERLQANIRAIRGVSRPSERREAQARQTQQLQRDIGQPVEMSQEMQEELLTDAEKKAIDDGTKTLEQIMAARGRAGRMGQTVVNIRTGRVSEARRAPVTRDLTKAAQDVENAEANRLSAQFAAEADEQYLKGLLAYAKTQLDFDLSGVADDVVAVEYAILNEQAVQAEEKAQKLQRTPTAKEQEKMVEGVGTQLYRVTSSEYTDRENTPLDETTTAAVNKGNLTQALTFLAENGSTPFVRMVAKRLLPMVENTSLETASLEGKGGEFDPNTNTVTLNKDALTEEDLIHEPVHAATIGVIDAKPDTLTKEQLDARTALEKLYAKMQERPEFKDEYGNVSFKEFVSELLSNQQVRDKVNQTAGLLRRIYEGFLRMLGIEPTTLSDKAVEQAFAMFSPSQASINREERLASIARGVFPGTATKYSSAVPKEVQDMVNRTIARTATLGDKIVANTMGLRLRTFIADQWAPVEALLKMGVAKGAIKEAQALQMRVYMRLFSNQQEYTNAALLNGVPELKTDADGVRNVEGGDAKANAQTIAAALSKASKLGNQQAVERLFTMWMASLRAKQDGVGFDKLNFKNPPTAAELTALEQMFKDNPDVKDAFEAARRLYKEHNKRLLNLQVQTGAMNKEVADELGQGDYIGYYRVNDNGVVELMMGGSRPMRIGSVVDQPYLKELVGGEQHILPFFSSMVQNTSMLMTIALKNMQNKNTAYMFQDLGLGKIHSVPEGKDPPAGKIRFKQGGNDYWFDADADAFEAAGIPADLMMQGLQGVKTTIPGLVRALAVPANFLRKAVRRLPTYTLRQTIRDPLHAWMITGGNFTPVLSTWKELYKGMTNTSQTQMTLKEAAVVGNNVYSGDTEGVADMLRQLSGNPSRFARTMQYLDEIAMKGEAATRAVLYDAFRQKGMGHVEALLNTAETMNFGRRGTSASLQWLSMLTPFFNAQIQGLDSVYRSLKGDNTFEQKMNARNMLLKRGTLLAAGTMMYAAMMEDDETYKNATPAERYGNWFVPVPGTDKTIRVPIPFELGLIFKSMPEAVVNTAFGDTKAKEAIKALAKQAYMSSPVGHSQSIPTAVKGPLELAFNYNMFSDQPVETARERAMDTDQRYRESTTEVAKLLGKFGVLSPVQIDHLVRSYTSSAGIALLSMANFALRPLTTREGVEKPDWVLEEVPVIGPLFQPKTGRGMVNAAFEDMMRIERAAQTYKTLAGSDPEAARAYADDYAKQISLAPLGGQFRQQMGEFAKYKRMIAANPDLTPAEKRKQIETIKEQEIQYSTMLRKLAA
jgi:hypothetical protein